MSTPWLTIVGIGEDGIDGLSLAARDALAQAQLVVGGRRHLGLVGPLEAETLAWPSPIANALPKIMAMRGEPVCVLASGDPFFYGVGTMLATAVPVEEMACLPAPSSFSLAASRLGWALQDCRLISLHGRDLRRIIPHIQPGAKILALSWDASTPGLVADLLRERGCGGSMLHVLESMGGPKEKRRQAEAQHFDLADIDPLNLVGVHVVAEPGAHLIPIAPGLPDDWFEHDGQITKREVRAVAMSALRPFRGGHLWDVGGGSGSVAIEWALLDPANRATAIEVRADRAARIVENAGALGVPGVRVVTGHAPDALADLGEPDAIFIGGGGSDPDMVAACIGALPAGGRLVVNAVTIETQAHLIHLFRAHGGDLTQISIAHADPVGRFHGLRPSMPVMQWGWTKP